LSRSTLAETLAGSSTKCPSGLMGDGAGTGRAGATRLRALATGICLPATRAPEKKAYRRG
jgi:hypothetical protein